MTTKTSVVSKTWCNNADPTSREKKKKQILLYSNICTLSTQPIHLSDIDQHNVPLESTTKYIQKHNGNLIQNQINMYLLFKIGF